MPNATAHTACTNIVCAENQNQSVNTDVNSSSSFALYAGHHDMHTAGGEMLVCFLLTKVL